MFATLALTVLAPMAGAINTPMEPVEPALVEAFLATEGGESACSAYELSGQIAVLGGAPEQAGMMQEMAEAYLIVKFETIWTDEFGETHRMTDDARDALHAYLVNC